MKKKQGIAYLCALCFLLTWNSLLALEKTELKNLPFSAGETLYYKLSYRGLLTSMIWADIADASMSFFPNQMTPGSERGHQSKRSARASRVWWSCAVPPYP